MQSTSVWRQLRLLSLHIIIDMVNVWMFLITSHDCALQHHLADNLWRLCGSCFGFWTWAEWTSCRQKLIVASNQVDVSIEWKYSTIAILNTPYQLILYTGYEIKFSHPIYGSVSNFRGNIYLWHSRQRWDVAGYSSVNLYTKLKNVHIYIYIYIYIHISIYIYICKGNGNIQP